VLLVETVLAQYERRVFSYQALASREGLPDAMDRAHLEVGTHPQRHGLQPHGT
jgi:hypothetical protein